MLSPNKKSRTLQLISIGLLIIALVLHFSGLRDTPYFVITMIAAVAVSLYWSFFENKLKKQQREKR
ncbi:hypothetical protein EQV77_13335 [Halobacillus fulvus]|nr:hypothetical protein EQV77_13335 [Halobacillus fulvus]